MKKLYHKPDFIFTEKKVGKEKICNSDISTGTERFGLTAEDEEE